MNFNKSIAAIALVSGVLAASNGFAQEPDSAIGCLHLSKRVAGALAANPQSPNYKAATDEQNAGKQFCFSGVYAQGIAHYERALDYLGQQSKG
jgi:hypothetical protein